MKKFKSILKAVAIILGISILLLGTAFGITYAIDKDLALSWIGIEKETSDTEEPDTPEEPEEPGEPIVLEFEFADNILLSYSGDETDIIIPSSYSKISELSEKEFPEELDLLDYLMLNNSLIEYPITVTDSTAQEYELLSEYDVMENKDIIYPVTMPVIEYTYIEGKDYDVTEINQNAFDNNEVIANVFIPACITNIGKNAFDSCNNLESIIFEENSKIIELGNFAFYRCVKLKNVDFGKNNQLETIGQQAFSGCQLLEKVNLNGSNKLKKLDFMLFSGCSALQEFIIPSSVTEIRNNVFTGCKSLTNIIIPSGVTSIAVSTFSGCTNLTEVIIESQLPPTLGENVFSNCGEDLIIYVPESAVDTYKTADGWSEYAEKIVGFYNVTYTEEDLSNYQGITKYLISASEGGTFNSLLKCIYKSNGEVYILSDCTSKTGENYLYQIKCIIDPNLEGLTLSSLIDKLKSSAVDTEVIIY